MVKIKVNGDGMVPDGTILEPMYIDNLGDARLSEDDARKYDISWVFKSAFELVDEEEPAEQVAEYTVTIKLKDLLELHDLLQVLPRSLVESATLERI